VLEYLKEPSISTLPFRRLAERNHEHASRVFQVVLKQPAFDWERDGEKLLRRYKKRWFEQPILPSITPVGDPLARAQMGSGDVDFGDTQSGPRSKRRPKRKPGRFQ